MDCCQCQGIEEIFSEKYVSKEMKSYRKKGPDPTTRMLAETIRQMGVDGLSLLDIGGGVGAIQHRLLEAGVARAVNVDASEAYLSAAMAENKRRGFGDRVSYYHGNFVDLAAHLPAADIVTLDRVICCYHDMRSLVALSAQQARRFYGLVYPRDTWWIKLGIAAEDFLLRLRRSPFRGYAHPTDEVEGIVNSQGLQRFFYRQTLIWQVAVYRRDAQPAL